MNNDFNPLLDGLDGDEAREPARRPQTQPEWFLAVEGVDVGPVDVPEIERRWYTGEITAETLVWRPGMLEWQPVTNVAHLSFLLTRAAQAAAARAIAWQNSGHVLSLSELTALEHEAATPAPPQTDETLAPPLDLPDLSALGFRESPAWDFGPPTAAGPAPVVVVAPTPWSKAAPERRSLWPRVVVALFVASVLALAAAVARRYYLPVRPAATEQPRAAPTLSLQPVTSFSESSAAAPEAAEAAVPPSAEVPAVAKRATRPAGSRSRATKGSPTPVTPPAELPQHLAQSDIVDGVKANAKSLLPCLRAARIRREIAPGKLTLVMSWAIQPSGAVKDATVAGPASVLGTSLPACVNNKARAWTFPAAREPSTVKNFPMPLTLR